MLHAGDIQRGRATHNLNRSAGLNVQQLQQSFRRSSIGELSALNATRLLESNQLEISGHSNKHAANLRRTGNSILVARQLLARVKTASCSCAERFSHGDELIAS